ncbi:Calcium-transporting ATPase 9, plasma membrane-type [Dendrobium catenatum]|uniref:Calcium-transporting ATPase 9, plasma membrane-type n=1 Tax=Dendrobium catenatum TaxID=906689 RepID=A0A2I0WJF9_9ASPA|nr:Calcium-transporting ATPase 9, plasma membrane-type [Dendrobium catenatum]
MWDFIKVAPSKDLSHLLRLLSLGPWRFERGLLQKLIKVLCMHLDEAKGVGFSACFWRKQKELGSLPHRGGSEKNWRPSAVVTPPKKMVLETVVGDIFSVVYFPDSFPAAYTAGYRSREKTTLSVSLSVVKSQVINAEERRDGSIRIGSAFFLSPLESHRKRWRRPWQPHCGKDQIALEEIEDGVWPRVRFITQSICIPPMLFLRRRPTMMPLRSGGEGRDNWLRRLWPSLHGDEPRFWGASRYKAVLLGTSNASKEKAHAHIRELEEEVKLLKNLSHLNIVVTAMGINIEWGLLMASISEDSGEQTPLQVKIISFLRIRCASGGQCPSWHHPGIFLFQKCFHQYKDEINTPNILKVVVVCNFQVIIDRGYDVFGCGEGDELKVETALKADDGGMDDGPDQDPMVPSSRAIVVPGLLSQRSSASSLGMAEEGRRGRLEQVRPELGEIPSRAGSGVRFLCAAEEIGKRGFGRMWEGFVSRECRGDSELRVGEEEVVCSRGEIVSLGSVFNDANGARSRKGSRDLSRTPGTAPNAKMIPLFKTFAGGPLCSGKQWKTRYYRRIEYANKVKNPKEKLHFHHINVRFPYDGEKVYGTYVASSSLIPALNTPELPAYYYADNSGRTTVAKYTENETMERINALSTVN